MDLVLEAVAVSLNLIYLFLLMKEKISCWYFGVTASVLSIYIFYSSKLYSEAILYVYYVVIGIYGYQLWSKNQKGEKALKVSTISLQSHVLIIVFGGVVASVLGYTFDNYSDASTPYLDATTTVFSFIASFLEARKILSSWLFWIFANLATMFLYARQDLNLYLLLTVVYFVFSIVGFREWRKSYRASFKN